jgi:hypothetical protein
MLYSCEIVSLEGLEFVGDRIYRTLFNGYSLCIYKKNLIELSFLHFARFSRTEKWQKGIIQLVM